MLERSLAGSFLWLITGVAGAQIVPDTVAVRLLHSNDVYGRLRPVELDSEQLGGMAARVDLIRRLSGDANAIVLDAGDAFGPSTLSAWDKGKVMVEAMRMAGYTAMTPGNHEFDHGLEELEERQKEAAFPFLAANVRGQAGKALPLEGYRIENMDGVKIGILGLVSETLSRQINPNHVVDLVVEDPVKVAKDAIKTLEELGTDFLIALVHMSSQEATALARNVPGINLVIAGGYQGLERTSQVPALVKLANGVEFVTTPRSGSYLGQVDLTFVRQKSGYGLVRSKPTLIPVDSNRQDDETVAMIRALQSEYSRKTGEALGRIAGKNSVEQAEIVANLMRWHTKMELGIVRRGAFRTLPNRDSLYLRDIDRFIRFDDGLVKLVLTGSQIKSVIRKSQKARGETGLIFAGLDPKSQTINNRPIQNSEPYQVVTAEILANGGDGYSEFRSGSSVARTGISLRSQVAAWLQVGSLSPEDFLTLDERRIWRSGWSVEGAFRRNYIGQTAADYQSKGERVSFLRGETNIAWNSSTQYFLSYEAGPHVVLFENGTDFGQTKGSQGNLETSSDRLDTDLTYRRRIKGLRVDPFVSTGIRTALSSGGGRRPFQSRNSIGFQRSFGRVVMQFAGRGQRDFAEKQSDFGAEVGLTYQRRLQQGGRFRTRVKSFFGLTDRKVVSIENYNTFSFPLAGSLSLAVRQNNFIYRVDQIKGTPVTGVAFRMDLTVGLAYGLDWKWF